MECLKFGTHMVIGVNNVIGGGIHDVLVSLEINDSAVPSVHNRAWHAE
jgi:hypothetical protein